MGRGMAIGEQVVPAHLTVAEALMMEKETRNAFGDYVAGLTRRAFPGEKHDEFVEQGEETESVDLDAAARLGVIMGAIAEIKNGNNEELKKRLEIFISLFPLGGEFRRRVNSL